MCCAPQTQKICNEFADFCAKNLHDLGGVGVAREFFALPNAALTQARMLRCLNREFGRRQEFCAAHARETRENFATNSRISGFSCAENLRDLGAEREFLCRQMLHRLKRELCRCNSVRSGNAIASFARREPKLQKILQQIQVFLVLTT